MRRALFNDGRSRRARVEIRVGLRLHADGIHAQKDVALGGRPAGSAGDERRAIRQCQVHAPVGPEEGRAFDSRPAIGGRVADQHLFGAQQQGSVDGWRGGAKDTERGLHGVFGVARRG